MFKVDYDELSRQAEDISEVAVSLGRLQRKLSSYSSGADLGISEKYAAVRGAISRETASFGVAAQRLGGLADVVRATSSHYEEAETAALDGLRNALGIEQSQGSQGFGNTGGAPNPKTGTNGSNPSWFSQFIQNKAKVEGSVKSGKKSAKGDFLGVAASGAVSGGLLNGEASFSPDAEFNINKGEIHAGAEGKASGSLAKGKVEGDYGVLHGDAKAELGTGAVSGKINATLMKDGKFRPQVAGEAAAKAAVASGEANVRAGGKYNNVHGNASGDLLVAEAKAKVHAGAGGVGATVEAGAYAAKGKVKGGFSFLGIKVDASVEGGAGGAGVAAGFGVDKKKISGKIGAGLGVGGGVEVSIDFSDAGAGIKKTVDWWNSLGKKKK